MKQSVSVITLPVGDLPRAKAFYCDGLGWSPSFDNGDIVFFQCNGFVMALWRRESFEAETGTRPASGHGSIALGHNVASPEEVDRLMALAQAHGATCTSPARALAWGGYSGYFADPDGHLWEIAHNPAWPLAADGSVRFAPASSG